MGIAGREAGGTAEHTEVEQMGIEPLSGVLTFQAQNIPKGQEAGKAEHVQVLEGGSPEAVNIDATTPVIEPASGKEQTGNQKQNANQNNQVNNEKVKKAVEQLNKSMSHSEAIFGIHEKTNRLTIRIIDKDTKEVIRELPPEKTLDMIAKVWELAGILVDEKR